VYDTITFEGLNKPSVALCNEGFGTMAKATASQESMPGLRVVPETVPCETASVEQVEAGVSAAIDDVVTALTKPLTDEEKPPKTKEAEKPRVAFKGDLEEVNRFFYQSGWGDGLPIMPPTEEAVAEMLTGTDLPADHLVGKFEPWQCKATVEKIAINAVMAGALPTYMPVLIAAVQALMDPKAMFRLELGNPHSFQPFWLINGRVRQDLNMNSSSDALRPGDIANATIGRAMGLIIKNVAHARKGIESIETIGNPAENSMVLAENEEANPWEPLHVEHGLNPEDSAVSFFYPNTCVNVLPYGADDDRGVLNSVINNIIPGRGGNFLIILPPIHAKTLAESGWTKQDIKTFVTEYARVPAYRHPFYWGGEGTRYGKEVMPINPMDSVRIFTRPKWLRIVVAGGAGTCIGMFVGAGIFGSEWVTKKVDLPANWDNLVAKYKNVVPKYTVD